MKTLIIGIIAGSLTTIAFLPQLIRAVKTKHTKDLSLGTFSLFGAGVFLWLIYGILLKEMPIILANAVTLIFVLLIAFMKIKHG
ncbi:MAG: SemiSWEET transporter [Candidatus Omnitrophica bacterium]|nr:SemiSWEET transporter [Candidatus Omnitrophota bacterium]